MCGIAGIVGNIDNRDGIMQGMLHAQAHRGPDAQGSWQNENIILGHNRLSIIDLNSSSNQPMHSASGKYVIIFNGEIYNYKELKKLLTEDYQFKTQSDTEVILAAYKKWGKELLSYLNGMFSFVIWDKENNTFFAARDRFGVKPFYYAIWNNNFYFASEIKTLWAAGIPKEKNLSVWAKYLAFGSYGLPYETFWTNIQQLPGGNFIEFKVTQDLEFRNFKIQPIEWYNFKERIELSPKMKPEDIKEQYLHLLKDAISLRFRADVPIGFNISGGLDSSILLAMVNEIFPENKSIEAYTFYTGHSDYDELPWVEKMINLTGNPLNKSQLKCEDVENLINEVSYFEDEPFGGFPTLAYSLIFKKARENGTFVLLDGQGMDEAWAGYDYYYTNTGFTIQGTKSSPVRPEVLNPDFLALAEKEVFPNPFESNLQNLQFRDLFYTKIPRALRFNDRISMMHGTELREPFLDYRLVEFAFAQKDEIKIQNGQSKWLLRQIVNTLLGDNIAFAPKRPLQTPQREWISNELRNFVEEKIIIFAKNEFVDSKKVMKSWDLYLNGDNNNSFFIWQWMNLNILSENS